MVSPRMFLSLQQVSYGLSRPLGIEAAGDRRSRARKVSDVENICKQGRVLVSLSRVAVGRSLDQ